MALRRILSAFGKLGIVALLAVAFAFGLVTTVYLSLRSPNVQVPDVTNKSYLDGEKTLGKAGLDISQRATRYKPDVPPGIILDQTPHAGEVVKGGQVVRVVVSRAPKEGETPPNEAVAEERKTERGTEGLDENKNQNQNSNRRRNTNRNTNANSNASANTNTGANTNGNAENAHNTGVGNTGLFGNRNAAPSRNVNAGANTNHNRNSNAGLRITNTSRPAAANANRRPTP